MNWHRYLLNNVYRSPEGGAGAGGAGAAGGAGGAAGAGAAGAGAGAGGGAAGAAGAGAGAAGGGAAPWYAGKADAETIGHWENRGLGGKSAEEIALTITKAHKDAERFLGIPKEQLLRKPDPKDTNSVVAFWKEVGAPGEAKDYDMAAVTDAKLADALRAAGVAHHVPKDMMTELSKAVVSHLTAVDKEKADAAVVALQTETETLNRNWGANKEANRIVAENGARALGADADIINALEKAVGYAKTMEMFRTAGAKMGEDKFITPPGGNGALHTADGATARIKELQADSAWVEKYFAGDAEAVRTMTALIKIANPGK